MPLIRTTLQRLAFVVLLLNVCAANAAGQAFQYQWNVRDIISADGDTIELRAKNNRLIKKVSATQMRILYAVKSSIEAVAELSTELIIVDGKQPNAFATTASNGVNVIGINFAMLDILELDVHAAAALIGHEMAHLKLDHGAENAKARAGGGMMKILGGVALSSLGVPAAGLISDITVSAITTKYSRDNENEADYLGAIWAVEADYEPDGAARLHESMYELSRHRPSPFLSSHPSGPERIADLKALARRLSVSSPAN